MDNFKVMEFAKGIPDLTKIKYPCYCGPLPEGRRAILYDKEGFFDSKGRMIENQNSTYFKIEYFVLDGFIVGNRFLVMDCMERPDWDNKKCRFRYEDRLKLLRTILLSSSYYPKILDLPMEIVNNPFELKYKYKESLQNGNKGLIIRSTFGKYQWEETTIRSGNLLKLEKTIDENKKI